MFATLLGPLPRPPLAGDASPAELLAAVVRAQDSAGLEPIIDAGFGVGETAVDRWRATAALTGRPVKAVLAGPYSLHRTAEDTAAAVDRLRGDILALAAAGCPIVEIHEPAAVGIGTDEAERTRFREAHLRLLDGVSGVHCSLAVTGGNADEAGIETLLAAPYASLAVDLVAGPDNWRLIAGAPSERGAIIGALSVVAGSDDRPEVLLWAIAYAASTGGRGRARVGLASAASMAHLPWPVAVAKMERLGQAARLADLSRDELARSVDPRFFDARTAALGRSMPRPRPRPRPRRAR
jgi:hypothetical protein